jgi:hypothetical protein
MKKVTRGVTALAVLTLIILGCITLKGATAWAAAAKKNQFTTDFRIEDCTFSDTGRNDYFSLNPGDKLTLTDGKETLEITVLNDTHDVTFDNRTVTTRVVEELETKNGAVGERSRNFFARCEQTNDIFYFGETVEPASIGGAWEAGVDGAVPGIIMPARFLLGSRYFQEQAPGVALDRAEHTKMGLTIDDPKNQNQPFEDCVEVVETTKLERGKSIKRYCPGVGLVFDAGLELTDYNIQ